MLILYNLRFLNSFPLDKNVDWSKFKRSFANDKLNLIHKVKFVVERVEKHCEKILDTNIFSLSHNVFKRPLPKSGENKGLF